MCSAMTRDSCAIFTAPGQSPCIVLSSPKVIPTELSITCSPRFRTRSTPTMLLSGEADLRTPIGQAEEFYRALMVLDQETMHIKLPDEYHGTRSVSHRLMIQLYLKAWFDKYSEKPIA